MAVTPPDDRSAPSPHSTTGAAPDVHARVIDGIDVLTVYGELDVLTAPSLAEAITTGLAATLTGLIVDLSELSFLASAGMNVLVEAQEAATDVSKRFAVVADGPATSRPMKLIGLDHVLRLYPTLAAALHDVA